ncbi:MAG TPA: DUF6624 domain-containing protein [Thermoanaerobaculia bacterium]|nr:DUF6624 domain-containing protein [Thermoanaerobaculia bacterium]
MSMKPIVTLPLLFLLACATTPPSAPEAAPAAAQSTAAAQPPSPPATAPLTHPELARELLAMRDADQRVRRALIAKRDDPALKEELAQVDAKNVSRVIEIIDQYGWPSKAMVGEKGSGAVWIILQHAPRDVLKRYLPRMEEAARNGDIRGGLLATSVDRVRIGEGKPQLYGTQFQEKDGTMVPHPIEDEANVDKRRAEVGLGPLAEYAEQLRAAYKRPTPK